MTTKLSLYVCNANTSWIEIAITFSAKSRETPVFLLFFTLLADPNRRPCHTQPHRLLTGSEHRAACGRWSGAMSRKKQRALRRAPRPRWLHITRFRLWRKLIHYVPRPLPKRQAFSEPPYRATMFLTERVVDLSPMGAQKQKILSKDGIFCFIQYLSLVKWGKFPMICTFKAFFWKNCFK